MLADYKCLQCEEQNKEDVIFEYFSVRSDDKPECPKCGAKEEKLEKQLSTNTSFILKGPGWFKSGGY